MDWSQLYPAFFVTPEGSKSSAPATEVKFLDVGCGYGGMLGVCLLQVVCMSVEK